MQQQEEQQDPAYRAAPKVVREEAFETGDGPASFRWVRLKKIHWLDAGGRARVWEAAERKTRTTDVDGVAICTILKSAARGSRELVLVSQFRPPLNAEILEMPAGLIDKGETAEEAAKRELYEETGYTGATVLSSSPILCNDPGMTTANMVMLTVEVDADAPQNVNPAASPDEGEDITVHKLPLDQRKGAFINSLVEFADDNKMIIDARLYHWAAGLSVTLASQ